MISVMFTAILSITFFFFFFCSFKNSHKQSASGSFSDSRWSLSQSGLSGIYHSHPFFNDNAVLSLAGKNFLKPHLIAGIIIIFHRGQQGINSNAIFVKRAFYCLMYYFYRHTISYRIKRMRILFSVIPRKRNNFCFKSFIFEEKSISYNSINYNRNTHAHLPTTIFICLQCIVNDYCYGPVVDSIKQYPFS